MNSDVAERKLRLLLSRNLIGVSSHNICVAHLIIKRFFYRCALVPILYKQIYDAFVLFNRIPIRLVCAAVFPVLYPK